MVAHHHCFLIRKYVVDDSLVYIYLLSINFLLGARDIKINKTLPHSWVLSQVGESDMEKRSFNTMQKTYKADSIYIGERFWVKWKLNCRLWAQVRVCQSKTIDKVILGGGTIYAKLSHERHNMHVWNRSTFTLMGHHKLDEGVEGELGGKVDVVPELWCHLTKSNGVESLKANVSTWCS